MTSKLKVEVQLAEATNQIFKYYTNDDYKPGDEPLNLDTQKLLSSIPPLTTQKIKVILVLSAYF